MYLRIYNSVLWLGSPLLRAYLRRRMASGKEHPQRFHERLGRPQRARPEGKLLWMHGASVGETLSMLPLIEELLKQYCDLKIMVTSGTVTSAEMMARRLPERAFHQFIPIDTPKAVQTFLDHWQPDAVLWFESDFWPNLVFRLKARRIPAALINARMTAASYKKWQRYGGRFIRDLLGAFSAILPQTPHEAEWLQALGGRNVKYIGNLKYAARPLPYDEAELKLLQKATAKRSVWLFSSTHANEEVLGGKTHIALKKDLDDILTIIAPRHPKRAAEILTALRAMGLNTAQRSKNDPITKDTDVYLADTMGELGLLYKLSPLVVMGNSFTTSPGGGHNVIEPAHLDCAILYGPYMQNFREICRQLEEADAIMRLDAPDDLVPALSRILKDHELYRTLGEKAKAVAQDHLDVIPRIQAEITSVLEALR